MEWCHQVAGVSQPGHRLMVHFLLESVTKSVTLLSFFHRVKHTVGAQLNEVTEFREKEFPE